MLESLHIENMAVIERLDVELSNGLTVITGETGSGKSVMLSALTFLLGGKPARELLRSGAEQGLVSAVFSNPGEACVLYLREAGFDCAEELMLQRTLSADGKSKCHLNGRAIPQAMLRELASHLVSMHAQNDNQRLLLSSVQHKILDTLALEKTALTSYRAAYQAFLATKEQIERLRRDMTEAARLAAVLRFQIGEIDAAHLRPGEEEELEQKRRKLQHAERIAKHADFTYRALYGNEKGNALLLVDRAAGALQQLAQILPEVSEAAERLLNIHYEIEDIANLARDLCEDTDGDPTAALNRVEGRLDTISKLRKKYGEDISAVLEFRRRSAEQLELLEHSEEKIGALEARYEAQKKELAALCDSLHEARTRAANELGERVMAQLSFLDMAGVLFAIRVTPTGEFGPDGADLIEFCISTSKGAPLAPLSRIASGGELARVMLAIKSVLNDTDQVATAVFDEVDTGISGKTSRKIGMKLAGIAKRTQVLCVTHSAQIASLAHTHLKITKTVGEGLAASSVSVLDEQGRIDEVARILGGLQVTKAQVEAAKDMIKEGRACQ